MLQASWGIGKGYYNNGQPPVEYAPQNPFYRFKTIGYNIIPEQDNSDGVVKLVFMKKLPELKYIAVFYTFVFRINCFFIRVGVRLICLKTVSLAY